MKLAYVIGPYRGKSIYEISQNIYRARNVAAYLWQRGFAVICPHCNTSMMDGLVEDKVFLDGDIEMLKRCDLAVTVDGWGNSAGSLAEVEFCRENEIPVFHSVHEVMEKIKEVV